MANSPKPFYYELDGVIIGPVTGIDLREAALAGNVVPTTLIANDPKGKWVGANQVRGLFDDDGRPLPHPPGLRHRLADSEDSEVSRTTRQGQDQPPEEQLEPTSSTIVQCPYCQGSNSLAPMFDGGVIYCLHCKEQIVVAIATQSNLVPKVLTPPEQWFCFISDQTLGPFTEEHLLAMARGGQLRRDDQVRTADTQWRAAGTLKGLVFPVPLVSNAEGDAMQHTPAMVGSVADEAVSTPETNTTHTWKKRRDLNWWTGWIVAGLFGGIWTFSWLPDYPRFQNLPFVCMWVGTFIWMGVHTAWDFPKLLDWLEADSDQPS